MRHTVRMGAALFILVAGLLAASPQAQARTYKVLYSFCSLGGCADGSYPGAGVIMDGAGALYGTVLNGGANDGGAVFKLTPNAAKTNWTASVLYSFCSTNGPIQCTDGLAPVSTLLRDNTGNLYGTTAAGGRLCNPGGLDGCGTAFALIRNGATYTRRTMHAFCVDGACTDGSLPASGLIKDNAGRLFGTTVGGSTNGDYGNVYRLTPNAAKTSWARRVLKRFCTSFQCNDGQNSYASLVMDSAGDLYGVTWEGGAQDEGVVFRLKYTKATDSYTYSVIYSFCTKTNCTDGQNAQISLKLDASGNLFGVTNFGGSRGKGTVFRLKPNAGKTQWTHQVLRNFCSASNCTDGSTPSSSLVFDSAGNIFGTTWGGGAKNFGTIFQLTPNAAKTAYAYKVLRSFCLAANCTDGSRPDAGSGGLMIDAAGHLYGTTNEGGANDKGTVFRLANN